MFPASFGAWDNVKAIGAFVIVLPPNEIDSGGVEVGVIGVNGVGIADCDGRSTVAVDVCDWLNDKLPLASDTAHLTANFVPRLSNSMSVASLASIVVCWLKLLVRCVASIDVAIADVVPKDNPPDDMIAVCSGETIGPGVTGDANVSVPSTTRRVPSGGAGTAKPFLAKRRQGYFKH